MVSKTEPLEWGMRKASIALPITILTPRSRYIHSLRSNITSLTLIRFDYIYVLCITLSDTGYITACYINSFTGSKNIFIQKHLTITKLADKLWQHNEKYL